MGERGDSKLFMKMRTKKGEGKRVGAAISI